MHHLLEILVDLLYRTAQSKHVVNLPARLSVGTLVEHSQHIAHADGRHDGAFASSFLLINGAEQVAGKIIVVISYFALR